MHKQVGFLNPVPLSSTSTISPSSSPKSASTCPQATPSVCSMSDDEQLQTIRIHPPPSISPIGTTPSWSNLMATYHKPVDYSNGNIIASPTKQKEYVRLFGRHESAIRIVFYRDHALWCPYCHKVQLLLELKRIPYKVKKVNMSCYGKKNKEFLRKVPSGLLPVIELDGKIITESLDIMFIIEEQFQYPEYRKTLPSDDNDKMQAFHRYMRLERLFTGSWLNSLRGNMTLREKHMKGLYHTLDLIDQSLGEFPGSYFYPGDFPSFIDINFSSIFERSRASLRYWRNLDIAEERPNIKKWFAKWEQWAPSLYLRSDEWTHIGALPPQIGPVRFLTTRSPDSLQIETKRNLLVLNDGPEKAVERNIAASNLCRNADIVVPDAIRGSQSKNPIDHQYIDHALRILAQVLFDPDLLEKLEERVRKEIPQAYWKCVADGVRFEKVRVCAPRDMPIPSMQQFVGAANWLLRTMEQDP